MARDNKKIALLFLTRQELNHPRIWEQLLEPVKDKFNLYIHSKEPMEDAYFKKFTIPTLVPTSYLVHGQAWQVLLREALKEESNTKFVYLSESCMPLYPLEALHHYLVHDCHSYVRYSTPWWSRESEREIVEIPFAHRWGNSEWIILNRPHARLIAEDDEILSLASKHINSDHEGYPSSLFSIKGYLSETVYRTTTYANFNVPIEPHPYHFREDNQMEEQFVWQAKRGGCLFARKFTPEFPAEKLIEIAHARLMEPPSGLAAELEQKILRLQAQEEMSQANICALLPMLLNQSSFLEVGCEIGVGVGLHLERLCEAVYVNKVYAVDDYKRAIYQGIAFDQTEEEALFQYVQNKMENLPVEMIRGSSVEVAKNIEDHSLDFIYFNCQHNKVPIEENLNHWFSKVRAGGIISGYQDSSFFPHLHYRVKRFFAGKKLELHQECVEPKLWWVQR